MNKENCQIDGCDNKAKWALYKHEPDGKRWLHVCSSCEREIGADNLSRAGGYYKGG